MGLRGRGAIVAGFAIAVLAAAPAVAGAQGGWHQVTGIDGVTARNTDEIGLERTADGVLHVAWTRAQGSAEALLHSTIAASGTAVAGPAVIFAAPGATVNNTTDLVAGPAGGLRVFFSSLADGQPFSGVMATATAPAAGAPWSAPAAASSTAPATSSPVYVASGIGAAVTTAGGPISIWGDSSPSGGGLHFGIDPAVPDNALAPSCCQVDPNIAVDAVSGATFAGWSELGPPDGLQVQPLTPSGPAEFAPGSAAVGTGQRVALSDRIGAPGVFAAYGAGDNPFDATPTLWQVGTAQAQAVKGERDGEHTVLAPAPGGRLWMAWDRDGRVRALRTNAAASKFGAVVSIKPPPGTSTIYSLAAEGSLGTLDLLALLDTPQGLGYWHHRVLPGLALKAKPKKVEPGKKVKFQVSDAGDPVSGAKVKLKLPGKDPAGNTNASGKVKLAIPEKTKSGRYKARAKKGGYASAKRRVKVKD